MVYSFTMPKISTHWGPLQTFLNINHSVGHICFLKVVQLFFGTKSGSYSGQKFISSRLGVFFDWETSIYFCPRFVHFGNLLDTLTLMNCQWGTWRTQQTPKPAAQLPWATPPYWAHSVLRASAMKWRKGQWQWQFAIQKRYSCYHHLV